MKSLKCIVILSLFFLISCKNNKSINTDKTVIEDSISSRESTTKESLEIDDSPPFEVSRNCNEISFESFFERFGKDSVFQKNRIKYPLKWAYYESLENSKLNIEMRNHESYRFFSFIGDEEASKKEYGAFEVIKLKQKDTIVYQRKGLDNGLLINFKFKLVDNCWFLVEILDEST